MTDITELAQREKFEALMAGQPFYSRYVHWCPSFNAYDYTAIQVAWEAYQAGGAELVEALEKSEKTSEARREAIDRTHNMFVRERDRANAAEEALEKAQAKATQQGNIACALFDEVTQLRLHADEKSPELRAQLIEADSELEALRQRIAELESRAVTAENLQESAYRAGLTAGWNFGLENNNDGFNKCLAAHAYGIKWEAE